jgi:hypothetical protein
LIAWPAGTLPASKLSLSKVIRGPSLLAAEAAGAAGAAGGWSAKSDADEANTTAMAQTE